jgi:N-acetylmuramoyl-L-alanine amidase
MELLAKPVAAAGNLLPALVLAAWVLAGTPMAAAAATAIWDVKKIDGDDYVSAENIKQFYRFTKLTRNDTSLVLENANVVMKLTIGSNECTMNKVKFVFSKPVEELNASAYISRTDLAKLIDPVLRPNFIKNAGNFRTVMLDAGHGGKDPGATNPYGTEADYNLKVAKLLRAKLITKGYTVIMTRDSDRFLSLQERVNAANAIRQDAIFISIHFNSGDYGARGIETFTLSPPGVAHYGRGLVDADQFQRAGNAHDSANVALATAVHGSELRALGTNTFDRGIKRARYTVLSGIRHPAILLEGGFMSHPYEARLIHNPQYQNALASGIAAAVDKYRFAVTPRPLASATN